MLKRILKFIAKNFVFVGGTLFVFVLGFFYAYLRPQEILINAVFLLISLGWTIFIIFYFWDLMDKNNKVENKDEIKELPENPNSSNQEDS